jgi:hypothetical protein
MLRKLKRDQKRTLRDQLNGICFRKLEPKRVLSVSASFVGNVLQINYDGSASNQATLDVWGSDFALDTDGNLATAELTGPLADLQRIHVNGNAGSFTWKGDFSSAPLSLADGNGRVVDISGLATAELLTSINVASDVRVEASSSVQIGGSLIIGGDLEIAASSGTITNQPATTLTVSGQATFAANSIEIGDDVADNINLGSLQFQSAGNVSLDVDSAILLAGANSANILSLTSSSSISDAAATLIVTSNADLTAASGISLSDMLGETVEIKGDTHFTSVMGDISVGSGGSASFGSLRFSSIDDVFFEEDSDVDLRGTSTAESLTLVSAGHIRDFAGASLMIDNSATLKAAASIELNEDISNQIFVAGATQLEAIVDVKIGAVGTAQFGSLRFNAGNVVAIQEDDTTDLDGSSLANSLSLTSAGAIEDEATATLKVTKTATLNAGANITLNDGVANQLIVGDLAQFSAATLINIGPAGTAQFGALRFNAGSSVTIQEDDTTDLRGGSSANSLSLISVGAIQDEVTATLKVTKTATLNAGTSITLNDGVANQLIVGDLAQFSAATTVNVGPAGTAQFGALRFNAGSSVTIQEDDTTDLRGGSSADSLSLTSAGAIQDEATATLNVNRSATLDAGTNIALTDGVVNQLIVGDLAQFSAVTTVNVGPAGTAQFGTLRFNAGSAVTIQEDDTTDLRGGSSADSLSLTSAGAIQDEATFTLKVTHAATLEAVTNITLNDGVANQLIVGDLAQFAAGTTIDVGSVGTAQFGSLRFTAVGAVTIQEDNDMLLAGGSSSSRLRLETVGSLTDINSSSLNVSADATFMVGGSLTLADQSSDVLSISQRAFVQAGGPVFIGGNGVANFGSLGVRTSASVVIREASSTHLDGVAVDVLNITSTELITQSGIDTGAGTRFIEVDSAAVFSTTSVSSSVLLLRNSNNPPSDVNDGDLMDNRFNGSFTAIGVTENLRWRNVSATASVGNIPSILRDLEIDLPNANIDLGARNLNLSGNLGLYSGGNILDQGASVSVAGSSVLNAANEIELGDLVHEQFAVSGHAYFSGPNGIRLGEGGVSHFGSLQFDSSATVFVREDSSTLLSGISTAELLSLETNANLADDSTASITVVTDASFKATSGILLNDSNTNVLRVGGLVAFASDADVAIGSSGQADFGHLRFKATGFVQIQEDSTTNLVGDSEATRLELNSSGSIQDDATFRLQNVNTASFDAQADITLNDELGNVISIGQAALFNAGGSVHVGSTGQATFGSLQFVAGADVLIHEDDSSELGGVSSVGQTLMLNSAGDITDNRTASLNVVGDALFDSLGRISLSDDISNQLNVSGFAQFHAGSSVLLGEPGLSEFGSIRFTAGTDVSIFEDNHTDLQGHSWSRSLFLTSQGSIRDSGDVSVEIAESVSLLSVGEIKLNDEIANRFIVGGHFYAKSSEDIAIGTAGLAQFGTLEFLGGGAVTIQEDNGIDLRGVSSAGSHLTLISTDYIRDDQSVNVSVVGNGTFVAGSSIELGENANNQWVIGGSASFDANDNVTLAADGNMLFGALRFRAGGNATISEDDATVLYGDSSANRLQLSSQGRISDLAGTRIAITGDVELTAGSEILLTDNSTDQWAVGGHVVLQAPISIAVGGAGFLSFGSISLFTKDAEVQEDGDSSWATIQTNNLRYSSVGFIKNLVEDQIFVAGTATLSAGKYIHLGRVDIASLNASTNAVGILDLTQTSTSNPLSPSYLFELSDLADEKGTTVLTDLPAFANGANYFLGKSSTELLKDYSFQQNLGRLYGLFVTNSGPITIESILAQDPAVPGDQATGRPSIYVQTLAGDLDVNGTVATRSSTTQNGALVLIAGDSLNIRAGGELVTEQVADSQALQRVLNSDLTANAYSYDELFGELVTTKFLFPNNYPYIPSPITSKFHTIALSFGMNGEVGFEFVIQYGDASGDWPQGVVRTFADAGDIVGSNVIQSTRSDVPIVSHVQADGRIATVVRNSAQESNDYYYDVYYLGNHTTVDSTVVFRRSTDFFLFENGGATDLATVVDTTVVRDSSQSLAGTSDPPGVPLPPDIEPFRFEEVDRPIVVLNESAFSVQNLEYDDRQSILQDEFEVAIYRVKFDDRNENGQVDRGEEPAADQILDSKQKRIVQESKDVKGPVAPSLNLIRQWQTEYEEDPTKTAGAYVIIGTDRIRGPVVIGFFILRDGVGESTETLPAKETEAGPESGRIPKSGPRPEDGTMYETDSYEGIPAASHFSIAQLSIDAKESGSSRMPTTTDPDPIDVETTAWDERTTAEAESDQVESRELDSNETDGGLASIAAGSVLWLQRYRARQVTVPKAVDYSRAARKRRGYRFP